MDFKALDESGFKGVAFEDSYGMRCTLQESSAACVEGDPEGWKIWFGIDELKPVVFRPGEGGWVEVPTPEDTLNNGKMHLSQRQIKEMLPALMYFVGTGYLPTAEEQTDFINYLEENNIQGTINKYFEDVSS